MFNYFKSNKKLDFKFKDSEKTSCFICNHVLDKSRPILYVTHDLDDGSWQFLCGGDDHEIANSKVVSLLNIVEIDGTVNDLYEMPLGYGAARDSITDKWVPFQK